MGAQSFTDRGRAVRVTMLDHEQESPSLADMTSRFNSRLDWGNSPQGFRMLIVFSGLPGTGKTTIASQLASRTTAVYLRIDTIEQAIRSSGALAHDVGRSGYRVANELALSNLRFGSTVIVDGVNPVTESRQAWREIASRCGGDIP
jgi:hypothetical protein